MGAGQLHHAGRSNLNQNMALRLIGSYAMPDGGNE